MLNLKNYCMRKDAGIDRVTQQKQQPCSLQLIEGFPLSALSGEYDPIY